jgi:hypothetical protein
MQVRTVLLFLAMGLAVSSVAQGGSVGAPGTVPGIYGHLWYGPGPLPGDLTGDGKVDMFDYLAMKTNLGAPIAPTWANGDFDSDGQIGLADLAIVEQNFGLERGIWSPTLDEESGQGGAVPEPLTILGLIMGAGGVACYLRKRQVA